jgi:hypothetical protein
VTYQDLAAMTKAGLEIAPLEDERMPPKSGAARIYRGEEAGQLAMTGAGPGIAALPKSGVARNDMDPVRPSAERIPLDQPGIAPLEDERMSAKGGAARDDQGEKSAVT